MNRTASGTAAEAAHPEPAPAHREPRLPIEPLDECITRRGGWTTVVHDSGRDQDPQMIRLTRTYFRARLRGWVSLTDADTMCVWLLGLHPCLVWGRGWWDALEVA